MSVKHILFGVILTLLLLACQNDPSPTPIVGDIQANAIKILVDTDGFYRLDQTTLKEKGFDVPDLATTPLQFEANGQPVGYLIADDALIFYGQAPQDRYTTIQPYLLSVAEDGEATPEMPAFSIPNPTTTILSGLPITVHLEKNNIYRSDARTENSDLDPWFWEFIRINKTVEVTIQLPPSLDGSGTLDIGLWGFTDISDVNPDHDLDILINGENIGTIYGDGQTIFSDTLTLPAGILQAGENNITLDNAPTGEAPFDVTYLDWFQITYTTSPEIEDDFFSSNAGTEGTITL